MWEQLLKARELDTNYHILGIEFDIDKIYGPLKFTVRNPTGFIIRKFYSMKKYKRKCQK